MRSCVFSKLSSKNYGLSEETCGDYFGARLRHQDKLLAPHTCCKTRVKNLLDWRNKRGEKMAFGKPLVWMDGKDHITDCYFCMTNPRVSAFTKIFVVWRNAIKVDGMKTFWLTTVGVWRCGVGSPWKDHSSRSSLFCAL